ncbi:MAG TPA: glycosyltransferase family 87 protein [Candidatus Binataceae bacterium]
MAVLDRLRSPATADRLVAWTRWAVTGVTSVALVATLWLAVVLHAGAVYRTLRPNGPLCDFCAYYGSALAFRRGVNPYAADIGTIEREFGMSNDIPPHATDPPAFILAFEPFTLLSPHVGYWVWAGLNLVTLLWALVVLLGKRSGLSTTAALGLAALALLYGPVAWHFYFAQSKFPILLLLVLVARCLRDGDEAAAGLLLALASLLRIFPLLLVGYLVLRGRWKALIYCAAGVAIGSVVTTAIFGVHDSLGFFGASSFLTARAMQDLDGNASLAGFISRLFWHLARLGSHGDLWRLAAIAVASLGTLALTTMATVACKAESDQDSRSFGLWIVTSVMLFPIAFDYYLVLLIIPLGFLATAAYQGRASRRALWMAIAGYLLTRNPGALPFLLDAIGIQTSYFSFIIYSRFFPLLLEYISAFWLVTDFLPDDAVQVSS